jgi:putative DNA primase/helicase
MTKVVETPGFFDETAPGVCFSNGRYHNGTLHPLTENDRNLFIIPHAYDEKADSKQWDEWASRFWPDPKIRNIIMEFLGSCLFGLAPKYERALFLYGTGNNGKSTLLHMIKSLFAKDAVVSINPHSFGNEYYRAQLIKAQLNVVTELRFKELTDTETVKAIISGESISARQPAGKVFFFEPTMGNIFAGNKLPLVNDFTYGFRKRFLLVPCEVKIPEKEIKKGYHSYLEEHAMQGFIRRIVQSAERLQARGRYEESHIIEAAKEEWIQRSDQVSDFINEALRTSNEITAIREIYEHYRLWSVMNGHKQLSKRNLINRLREHGIEDGRTPNYKGLRVTCV